MYPPGVSLRATRGRRAIKLAHALGGGGFSPVAFFASMALPPKAATGVGASKLCYKIRAPRLSSRLADKLLNS